MAEGGLEGVCERGRGPLDQGERLVREEGQEEESYCLQVHTFGKVKDGAKVGRLTGESEQVWITVENWLERVLTL